jgi:hypothetical protein
VLRILAAASVLLACGGRAAEPIHTAPDPEPEPVQTPVVAPLPEAPRRSCLATAPVSRHRLTRATAARELGERSFALAWRPAGENTETVIVSLDAAGALTVTPVPVPFAEPMAFGVDAGGLTIVSVATKGTGTLLRVALAPDGSLRPGKPTRLPEVAWGWPASLSSDGTHAILEHTLATPEQGLGATALYKIDLATQRVIDTQKAARRAEVHCHAGACTTIEVTPPADAAKPARASLVHQLLNGQPETRLELEFGSTCPAFYSVPFADGLLLIAPGDPWKAVQASTTAPFLRELPLDPALAAIPGCPPLLHAFPSPTHPGVILDRGTLIRWDAAQQKFGASEALPANDYRESVYTTHADGVIAVAWTGGHGMMHSPTDSQGMRRYFDHWSFEGGQVTLLRHEGGRWVALDRAALPLAGADGTFHDGYRPTVLRHGLHAAVLLAPDGGGDDAYFQPYLAPCP